MSDARRVGGIEKERGRHVQFVGKLLKQLGADPTRPAFESLYSAGAHAQSLGEIVSAFPHQHAEHADPAANLFVHVFTAFFRIDI
ncbi:ribosomal 50S subunit-associated protein YjgA (DUF615 family) [Rhodoblastus acidophilus]|nr:hypothetical protein [Rhodoblastus acidophilus]MCW2273046.1 ribosomal 50S subunit-associated protein YjgA (DUF615 family) [Rhodoblastus acidophilus]